MFKKFLAPHTDEAYAFMRVLSGLMFSFHGMQKIVGILTPQQPPMGSQVWVGGIIELVAGLTIAAGFCTSCAAFVASGTMAVAYAQFHWRFAFDQGFFPAVNKGELAAVYAIVFFYMACRGSGPFSIDALRARNARDATPPAARPN